jgi:hypothetical protein
MHLQMYTRCCEVQNNLFLSYFTTLIQLRKLYYMKYIMKIIMNDLELRVWKDAVVAYSIVVSRNSPTETENIHEGSL